MKELIEYIEENTLVQIIIITIIVTLILGITIDKRMATIGQVQCEIVKHDYGQIFETIEDWKLYKIEKYEKGKENEI